MAFYVRLRLNEGAIKARVKSDTSANNWPMNAQFFFSSYVTCHATSWTRTPSGGGSRGTKDKLQRLRQITPCLSPCTDPAIACVAWRFWLGALSNKGGRGQRNREEIGAEAT